MEYFSFAQTTGYVAYALSFYACLQKDDKKLFRYFAYTWVLFSLHHYLMGNWTACSSGAIISARMYLSQYYKGARMAFPFAAIAIVLGFLTYQTPYSLLPLGAVLLATFGSAYFSGIAVRMTFIGGSFLWVIHNYATHSVGGMALDITTITMHTVTCWRIYQDKKRNLAPA